MSGTSYGQAGVLDANSDFSAINFVVRQMMARLSTATLAQVKSVDTSKKEVSVQPLVAQVDGFGNATQHSIVYGIPYCRLQGGSNAIILDPVVGDIGVVVFASRDISAVKSAKGPANPGSRRRFSMADGLYIASVLGANPTNYIKIDTSNGNVSVQTSGTLTIQASNVTLDASGNLHVNGNVTTAAGIGLNEHIHTGVQSGPATSGPPQG